MQYSILYKQKLHKRLFRLDPEYYSDAAIKDEELLTKTAHKKVSEVCYVTDGEHGTVKTFKDGEIKYFGARNVLWGILEPNNVEYISREDDLRNKRSKLKAGDVLISCVGANVGYAALVPPDIGEANIVRNVSLLRSQNTDYKNQYILSYFLSKYGKTQFVRVATGNAQPLVSLDNIKEIVIPHINSDLQNLIVDIINCSVEQLKKAKSVFNDANDILLSEFGLSDWQAQHHLSFIRNSSDVEQAERIDAEYFQPRYDEIVSVIKSYSGGWDSLDNLVTMKKCVEVGSDVYLDAGIPFVRISNLSPFEISEEKYISEELYAGLSQHQPKQGEILLSKDGSPGIACHLRDTPQKIIPSGGILRLKIKDNRVNEDYLTLVLNSLLTKEQVNRDCGGSIILHWRPDQVKEILIPILPKKKQLEIQQKVTESFNLRKQSKHLLECAKRAVEIAIEQDEETAIQWLEVQTKEQCG